MGSKRHNEIYRYRGEIVKTKNLFEPAPGKGFHIYNSKDIQNWCFEFNGKCIYEKIDVFEISHKFLEKNKLKKNYDFLVIDFHGEITSEKNAIGHFFDGKATLVVGTHTQVPTNDARILKNGTGYLTDAGMCGDYDSVIGMNKENSIKNLKKILLHKIISQRRGKLQ